jgi:shikimate dehydrogenase
MRRYGLIGYPLTHSFSKKYFTEKFQREGITDAQYELYPIKDIYELRGLIKANPDLLGLNVTIPFKQLVLRHLYSTTGIPFGLRACNCIKIIDKQTYGYNTDVIAFEKSFIRAWAAHHKKALILGNGGATAAVGFVLQRLNIPYQIVSRKIHDRSALTYADVNESIIRSHNIIINTTPLGMYPEVDRCPPIPYQHITAEHYLYDLIYNPGKTAFLEKGEERGASIKNGLEMLQIQAEESWKIWTAAE